MSLKVFGLTIWHNRDIDVQSIQYPIVKPKNPLDRYSNNAAVIVRKDFSFVNVYNVN